MDIHKIAVAGAGTMGSGIAQAAAQSGYDTILFDQHPAVVERAKQSIRHNLQLLADKQKIAADMPAQVLSRLHFTTDITECRAGLVIEAIIEDTNAKHALFDELAAVNGPSCVLVSNTSSLSVDALQQRIPHPERFAGMHFFNPATLMKLVEVVKGKSTAEETIKTLVTVCTRMGKVAVVCKDAPGFIVNRVARHYYLEAMKLFEEGAASFETIDSIMESTGFKMGPFRLMDLIGMDINLAVSTSLYQAFGQEERFRPSPVQIEKVEKGQLGRKSGQGFYTYEKQ